MVCAGPWVAATVLDLGQILMDEILPIPLGYRLLIYFGASMALYAVFYHAEIRRWVRRRRHPGAAVIADAQDAAQRKLDEAKEKATPYMEDAIRAAQEAPWLGEPTYHPEQGTFSAAPIPGEFSRNLSLWIEARQRVWRRRSLRARVGRGWVWARSVLYKARDVFFFIATRDP